MSASECQVRLHRDALSTPWGFRLQGGKDFKTPLTVQRVFVGSPADGELHRGDIIVSIDNYDATQMIHKQAMDIIKQAGGSITLRVRKSAGLRQVGHSAPVQTPVYSSFPASGPQYRSRTLENISSPTRPAPTMYGHDYGSSVPQYQQKQVSNPMLNKLQHTLTHAVWSPQQHNDYDEDYHPQTVSDLKSTFDRPQYIPPPPQEDDHAEERVPVKERKRQYDRLAKSKVKPKPITIQRPLSYNTKPPWVRPEPMHTPTELAEPGWTPKTGSWSPVKPPQSLKYQPLPKPHYHSTQPQQHYVPPPVNARPPVQAPRHIEPEIPAWAGTLKSSGGYKKWEVREAEAIAGPGVAPPPPQQQPQHQQQFHPEVAQHSPHVPVHQPRVQKLHYGPGDTAPTYSQSAPTAANSDTAQIKHLQYNSPIGLYSKSNVEAALHGQTTGKPGQGTMQVTGGGSGPGAKPYDPNKSDVYKLLHEEEQRKRGAHQPGVPAGAPPNVSARYQDPSAEHQGEMHYQGYMDHNKQSPAMGRLEQRIADGTVGTDLGTSDF